MNERLQATTLTDEQRNNILSKYSEMDAYFNMIRTEVAKKQPHEDLGYSIDDVHYKLESFKSQVNKIFTQPPPQPKSAEKPAEGDSKRDPDVDMKPEDAK